MAKREPIVKNKDDAPGGLVIEGAGEFNGRPDGKTSGRGMLGLVSAIPPAPNLPNVRGVRMLAPTVPSIRPSEAGDEPPAPLGIEPLAPIGLPDEERARDAEGDVAPPERRAAETEPLGEMSSGPAEIEVSERALEAPAEETTDSDEPAAGARLGTLLLVVLALAAIPAMYSMFSGG